MAEYNFGDIVIDITNRKANVSIKDMENHDFLNRTFDLTKDLLYKPEAKYKNVALCQHV